MLVVKTGSNDLVGYTPLFTLPNCYPLLAIHTQSPYWP